MAGVEPRIARRAIHLVALAVVMTAAAPTSAHAQLGWIKRLLGKKSSPPAQQAGPAAGQATGGGSTPAEGGPAASPTSAVPRGAEASGAAAATGAIAPVPDPAAQAAAASAVQREEYERRLAYGRMLDQRPRSLQSAQDRVQYWEGMKLTPPFNPEVLQAFEAARRDLEAIQREDSVRRASDTRLASVDKQLNLATQALRTNSFSDVISISDDVLAGDPGNERARRLKDLAEKGEKARRLKVALFTLGAAALALFVFLSVFARKLFKKDKGDDTARPSAGGGVAPRVYVKVVDGIGRGKLVAIPGDVFRIGAMESPDESDRNDLVLSDSAAAISRHHCDIIRKGRDYYLVDSSRNGTRLNDRVLARGDERRLRDGDEFTLADVSRLKFVRT